jgi:hypothetical protein
LQPKKDCSKREALEICFKFVTLPQVCNTNFCLKPLEFYHHLLLLPSPTNLFSKLERHPKHDLIKSHNIFASWEIIVLFLLHFDTPKKPTLFTQQLGLFFMHFCIRKRYTTHLLYLTLGLVLSLINPLNIEI